MVGGDLVIDGLAARPGRREVAFTGSWPDRPSEVVRDARTGGAEPAPLTDLNGDFLAEVELAPVMPLDGHAPRRHRGRVLRACCPPGRAPERLPLHVDIHGGPHASWPSGRWLAFHQALAAAGYVVVLPNPRGSTSYGQAFTSACTGDWGGGDADDIVACCDDLIERGVVDGARMFLSGGSYGGFMATWLVGHTDRFRAATAMAAVIDQTSMALTTEITDFVGVQHGRPAVVAPARIRAALAAHVPAQRDAPVLVSTGRATSACRSARARSSTAACACSARRPSSCATRAASTSSAPRRRRSTTPSGSWPGTASTTPAGARKRAGCRALDSTTVSGAERLNASTLLDHNLDAGRANKSALLTADGSVTYGELASLTGAVASYLIDLGVEREQRVLMILDDSPAFPATFLGAMRIGAVPVPVNPMDRVDNYVYYLDDSYASVLVVEASLLPALESELESRLGLHVLVVDGDPGPHASFDVVARERGRSGELPPPTDTHREDMAFWLYSSGSTGRPKGVVHAHGDIEVTVDQYARNILEISAEDVCYSTTKLFHAYGLGNGLTFPLSVGACAGLMKGRSVPGQDLRGGHALPADAVLLGAGAVRGDGQGPGRGRGRLLVRARLRIGGRGAAGRGARALAGARRRPDSRRDRLDRDAPHLLLEHARRSGPRNIRAARARIRVAGRERARARRPRRRGGRPDGSRR